jgi:hypothetical protein
LADDSAKPEVLEYAGPVRRAERIPRVGLLAIFLSAMSGLFSLPFIILGIAGLYWTLSSGAAFAGGGGEVICFSSFVLAIVGGLGVFISIRWLRFVYRGK